MRPERKAALEQAGYTVMQYNSLDPYWNTDTFVITPDGHTLADYTTLDQIPILDDNTEIQIDPAAFPYDDQVGFYCGQVNGGAFLYVVPNEGLVWPAPAIVMWIAITIVTALVVTAIFFVLSAIRPEALCKDEPRQQDIGNCAKLIVMQNCDTRTFNPCTGEWIDSDWTSHGTNDWLLYIVLAIAGIAAIVIIPKILGLFKGKIRFGEPPPEESAKEPVYKPQ